MTTKYGEVQYILESDYGDVYFVYGVVDNMVKVGLPDRPPKLSLLRTNSSGDVYFMKEGNRVYLDKVMSR